MTINLKIAALFIAGIALSGTQVAAQTRTSEQTHVSTAGVDFQNDRQVGDLYQRLKYAAKRVCDSEGQPDVLTQEADRTCESEALGEAISAVRNDRLTRYADAAGDRRRETASRGSQMAMNDDTSH